MKATYRHGPDRTPFTVAGDGTLMARSGRPFHGIISRGLRDRLEALYDGPGLWERNAHLLDDAAAATTAELLELRWHARDVGVLSLGWSALAASGYMAGGAEAEFWNIKEGHTSSVWVVTRPDGQRFVLNVSRDDIAAKELRDTSQRLLRIAEAVPEVAVARVEDIAEVRVGQNLAVVVRNALIEDALEVHRLPGGRGYAFVERFLPDADAPARIRAARGRLASPVESALIEETIERVLGVAAPDLPVALDVNDGDLVWAGSRAHVVAIG